MCVVLCCVLLCFVVFCEERVSVTVVAVVVVERTQQRQHTINESGGLDAVHRPGPFLSGM